VDVIPDFVAVAFGPPQDAAAKLWAVQRKQAFLRLGDQLPDPALGGGAGGSPTSGLAEFADAIKDLAKPSSLKDQETLSNGLSQQAGLQLVFFRIDEEDDGAKKVVPAKTLPSAEKTFKMSASRVTPEHQRLHEENLVDLQSTANMEKTVNANITHAKHELTSFASQLIRDDEWTTDSLDSPNCKPAAALGSLFFVPPKTNSIRHNQVLDNERLLLQQLKADEHSSKRVTRSSELCIDNSLEADRDILSMCSNTRAGCATFISSTDCDKSKVGVFLHDLCKIIQSKPGRIFFSTHRSQEVLFTMAVAVDDCLRHVSNFANRTTICQAVVDDKDIDTDVFDDLDTCADMLLSPIRSAINRNAPGDLAKPSCGSMKFLGNKQVQEDKRRQPNQDRNDRAEVPKVASGDNGPITGGFLVWKGTGEPPALDVKWKKTDGSTAEICTPFVCQGAVCPNRRCPKQHVFNPRSMPEDKRKQLAKQVSSTPHSECAPGFEPAGAP